MKKILLYILMIITFILIIISKETNLFLAFSLLFIPLILDVYFIKKEGLEIIRYDKIIILFYVVISVIFFFITNSIISSSIILLLMLIYYFYNPKYKIEEKYVYVDKIKISNNNISPKLRNNFIKAGISIINTPEEKVLTAENNKELLKLYHEIELNRSYYENLVRCKKLHIISSFLIPFVIVFIFISQLPNPLNITNLLLIHFLLAVTNIFLAIYLPSEDDIMLRKPRQKKDILFSKEEKLFINVNIFSTLAAITIPYMFILYASTNQNIAMYVFMCSVVLTNLLNIAYHLNDSPSLKNLGRLLYNKIYLLIILISSISLIIIHYKYDQYNIFQPINYIKLFIIIFISIGWEDIIKLARFLKNRKKNKNVKNN